MIRIILMNFSPCLFSLVLSIIIDRYNLLQFNIKLIKIVINNMYLLSIYFINNILTVKYKS